MCLWHDRWKQAHVRMLWHRLSATSHLLMWVNLLTIGSCQLRGMAPISLASNHYVFLQDENLWVKYSRCHAPFNWGLPYRKQIDLCERVQHYTWAVLYGYFICRKLIVYVFNSTVTCVKHHTKIQNVLKETTRVLLEVNRWYYSKVMIFYFTSEFLSIYLQKGNFTLWGQVRKQLKKVIMRT